MAVKMKKQIRVLCDLDGVLSDFAKQYKLINGVYPINVYQPGSTPSPEKDRLWNRYVDRAGFEDAPLCEGAVELIEFFSVLLRDGLIHAVEICSSAGGKARMEDVTRQKKLWLKHHELDDLVAHIVQNGYKKADVIDKNKYHDILIDDTDNVLENFVDHGGYGILHTSASSTIQQLEKLVNELSRD